MKLWVVFLWLYVINSINKFIFYYLNIQQYWKFNLNKRLKFLFNWLYKLRYNQRKVQWEIKETYIRLSTKYFSLKKNHYFHFKKLFPPQATTLFHFRLVILIFCWCLKLLGTCMYRWCLQGRIYRSGPDIFYTIKEKGISFMFQYLPGFGPDNICWNIQFLTLHRKLRIQNKQIKTI